MNLFQEADRLTNHTKEEEEEEERERERGGMMNKKISRQSMGSSISSSDVIDAKLEEHQLCGSKHCPSCGHKLEGRPAVQEFVGGLPAGVKFDPTDQELIEHLDAKVLEAAKHFKSHPLIDEFIPTIEGDDGICYTHPQKLPGIRRDGLSRHFFHRPSKAYTTGTRKRRKIQTAEISDQPQVQGGETRWHKTGKTRAVMVKGKQKGCKKILVLYTNFGKNRKPEKTNWVMHQYHLGKHEEEKDGELVVSKIFYQTQPRQCSNSNTTPIGIGIDQGENSRELLVINNKKTNNSSKRRDHSGSGSTCSSKEMSNIHRDDDELSILGGAGPPNFSYSSMEIQQLKVHHHHYANFVPFGKIFDDQVAGSGGEVSNARGSTPGTIGTCEEHDFQSPRHHRQQSHHQQLERAAFHISRPFHDSISTIISSPPPPPHNQTSIINNILDEDSFHVSRLMLQNDNFQQDKYQQQQQHHKVGAIRSASGLEELIIACTNSTDNIKEESSITNSQEAEWLKYSNFWPDPHDPDNPNHHG